METTGGILSETEETVTAGSRATVGAAAARDRFAAGLWGSALGFDFADAVAASAVFRALTAFFAVFAARLASLNFCLACLKTGLGVLCRFLRGIGLF